MRLVQEMEIGVNEISRAVRETVRLSVCFALFLGVFLASVSFVLAQESIQRSNDLTSLKGLSRTQIVKLLGKPDSLKEQPPEKEAWTYGRSLILFTDGVVSGWSNAGELRPRRNLARVKNPRSSEYDRFSSSWTNDWTPQDLVEPEEVISDIMEDMELQEPSGEAATVEPDYSSKSKLNEDESVSTSSTVGKASSMSSSP